MKKLTIIMMAILMACLLTAQNASAITNARVALSPYFQTDADSTYSFLGVTHPSLANAASTIGVTVATVGSATVASSTFTVQEAETYRIFIVSTNHTTINSSTITGTEVVFLAMTSGSSDSAGVVFTSSATNPAVAQGAVSHGPGLASLNMLTIWGAVVIPGTTSGFAMEFVGDAHNSAAVGFSAEDAVGANSNSNIPTGRGIN